MSNARYINGWECQCCSELYSTERKAINCFNEHDKEELADVDWDDTKAKARLIKGFECCDCSELYDKKRDAKNCCHSEYPEEKDDANYDMIGKKEKKKNGI